MGSEAILIFKILHIIGFVAWFAGLFYLVRMFVYHTESFDFDQPKKDILSSQFGLMEKRVYTIICNPAMMITWTFGLLMIYAYGLEWFKVNHWLHFKLLLLIILTIYHLYCKSLMKKLANGKTGISSTKFRLFNEVPTLLLIAITSFAVFKNSTNPFILLGAIVGVVIVIFGLTKMYKRIRESNN